MSKISVEDKISKTTPGMVKTKTRVGCLVLKSTETLGNSAFEQIRFHTRYEADT